MHAGTGGAHQLNDRGNGDGLGKGGNSGQTQARGHFAVVRHSVLRQISVLRAQPDAEAESGGVLERAPQHLSVLQRHIGMGEANAAGIAQFRHLGKLLAGEADSERADRINVRQIERLGAVLEHLHQAGFVQRRIGVGRTGEAGHAARDCGQHFRLQRRLILEAGFAQSRRQVDQPRAHHQAHGIDHAVCAEAARRVAHGGDLAGGDEQVRPRIDVVGRVDQATVLDMNFHLIQFPASMLITAILTAMPNLTCGRITACAPSATAESISTPRFNGPGCMTIASGLASASFSGVRP